jgi:hypothetical protein
MVTVGIYRWSLILTGRREVSSCRADPIEEADWHKRGTLSAPGMICLYSKR